MKQGVSQAQPQLIFNLAVTVPLAFNSEGVYAFCYEMKFSLLLFLNLSFLFSLYSLDDHHMNTTKNQKEILFVLPLNHPPNQNHGFISKEKHYCRDLCSKTFILGNAQKFLKLITVNLCFDGRRSKVTLSILCHFWTMISVSVEFIGCGYGLLMVMLGYCC